MKVRLRKVGVGSVFLLALVIYGTAGLMVGALVAAAASVPLPQDYQLTVLDRLGPWALAVFPAIYGLAGGIFASVAAILYNLAAAVTRGITLELSGVELAGDATDRSPGGSSGGSGQEAADDPAGDADDPAGDPAGDSAGDPSPPRSSSGE
jgi:hypothetical protein